MEEFSALVNLYVERPITVYARAGFMATFVLYMWFLFGKQLRPTRDLENTNAEIFANRWRNAVIGFQVTIAFLPLLAVAPMCAFLARARQRASSAAARIAPAVAVIAVETTITLAIVVPAVIVFNLALRTHNVLTTVVVTAASASAHVAVISLVCVATWGTDPTRAVVTAVTYITYELYTSGYPISPNNMEKRGYWMTYTSLLRYAYDAGMRLWANRGYLEDHDFRKGAAGWSGVSFDLGMLTLINAGSVVATAALAYRRYGPGGENDSEGSGEKVPLVV